MSETEIDKMRRKCKKRGFTWRQDNMWDRKTPLSTKRDKLR